MEEDRFKIVFDKLAEIKEENDTQQLLQSESDEIAALREAVLEITDPELTSYTTT